MIIPTRVLRPDPEPSTLESLHQRPFQLVAYPPTPCEPVAAMQAPSYTGTMCNHEIRKLKPEDGATNAHTKAFKPCKEPNETIIHP